MKLALNNHLNIVFDLDGTVIKNGVKMTSNISRYILNLSKKFNIFFASARPIRDMLPLLPKALHDTVLVGCNGGQVWCNGEMIYSNYFDTADVDKVLTLLNDLDVSYVLDTDWNYSFSSKFHEFYDYIRKLSVGEVKIKEAIDLGVTKILVLNGSCKSSIKEYLEVNNISNKINSHKSEEFFDITPEYTDKANTLERLGVDFGITISLGNDENDFRMLEKSLISLFVGDEKDYGRATYYCDMDTLLSTLNHAMRTLDVY